MQYLATRLFSTLLAVTLSGTLFSVVL